MKLINKAITKISVTVLLENIVLPKLILAFQIYQNLKTLPKVHIREILEMSTGFMCIVNVAGLTAINLHNNM